MRIRSALLIVFVAASLLWHRPVFAQFKSPIYTLTDGERQELTRGRDDLRKLIDTITHVSDARVKQDRIPDAEIYLEAVDRELRQNLFFGAGQVKQARACLAEGIKRATELSHGETPWLQKTGVILL